MGRTNLAGLQQLARNPSCPYVHPAPVTRAPPPPPPRPVEGGSQSEGGDRQYGNYGESGHMQSSSRDDMPEGQAGSFMSETGRSGLQSAPRSVSATPSDVRHRHRGGENEDGMYEGSAAAHSGDYECRRLPAPATMAREGGGQGVRENREERKQVRGALRGVYGRLLALKSRQVITSAEVMSALEEVGVSLDPTTASILEQHVPSGMLSHSAPHPTRDALADAGRP